MLKRLLTKIVQPKFFNLYVTRCEYPASMSYFRNRFGGPKEVRWLAIATCFVAAIAMTGCSDAPEAPPNILLVMVDTLRKDQLGVYGYERDTTPVIDALAESGLVFENAVAQSSWTLPSLWSLFTSRYPGELAPRGGLRKLVERLPEATDTLAEILEGAGYRTVSISSSPYTTKPFATTAGFGVQIQKHRASAEELIDLAFEQIDRHFQATADSAAPLFLYLHLLDVHAPYAPPAPYDTLFPTIDGRPHQRSHRRGRFDGFGEGASDAPELAAHRSHVVALYDGSIRYVDFQLGRLIKFLEQKEVMSDSVIAIVSDHGEAFWENTSLERKLDLRVGDKVHWGYGHGHTLFPELVDVPFILSGRGVPVGRVRAQVRNIDIAPTLLALAGVNRERLRHRGVDLVARVTGGVSEDLPALSETSLAHADQSNLRDAGYQLLRLDGRDLLFQIDGPKLVDVSKHEPEKLASLAAELDTLLDAHTPESSDALGPLDAKTREALRALGYLE
jgi:arylsulfatase A-like enzyme